MNAQKKVSLKIRCPQCKQQMQAGYDMSDHFLDGSCGECGHKIHTYSPQLAQKIQAKILERKQIDSDMPDTGQSVPRKPSAVTQKPAVQEQTKPVTTDKPEKLELVPEAALDNTAGLDDDDKKPDMFVLILSIAAIITVVIYLFTFTLDGMINWVVMGIPVIALLYVWRSSGRVRLFHPGNDTFNTMLVAMFVPVVAFALLLAGSVHVLDYMKFWIPFVIAVLITVGIFYYAGIHNQEVANTDRILSVVCAIIFAYGLVMFVNFRFDSSGTVSMQDPVLAKYSKRDYSGSAILYSHFITIPSVRNNSAPDKIGVSGSFYDYIKPGEDVLVEQMHGFLKIPWYRVKSTDRAHPVF